MVEQVFGLPRIKQWGPQAPRHRIHPGWPELTEAVHLADGARVQLRPLVKKDQNRWRELRVANQEFLEPVEPTVVGTWEEAHGPAAWSAMFDHLRLAASSGTIIPLVIELDGMFAGQLTLGNIQHGIVSDCWIGYWVDAAVTGRGVAKTAVALGTDLAFTRVGLHRVTATYLPSNPASGKVLADNGYREEGVLRRNLHVNGAWQDHILMALVADDYEKNAVDRLRSVGVLR